MLTVISPARRLCAPAGRILDLAQKGVAKLDKCGVCVMDEVRTAGAVVRCGRSPKLAHAATVSGRPAWRTLPLQTSLTSSRLHHSLCLSTPCASPPQADKLLSPEFQPVVEQLISFLPQNRQICLYRCAIARQLGPGWAGGPCAWASDAMSWAKGCL